MNARRRNQTKSRAQLDQYKAVQAAIHESLPKRSRDELRKLAKEMGVKGSWKMSKPQLIEAIRERW